LDEKELRLANSMDQIEQLKLTVAILQVKTEEAYPEERNTQIKLNATTQTRQMGSKRAQLLNEAAVKQNAAQARTRTNSTRDVLTFPREVIEIGRLVGKGADSKGVFLAKIKHDLYADGTYVVKFLTGSECPPFRECQIKTVVPGLVQPMGIVPPGGSGDKFPECWGLIMPYCNAGTLSKPKLPVGITAEHLVQASPIMGRQLVETLLALHKTGFIHSDLHGGNIFLSAIQEEGTIRFRMLVGDLSRSDKIGAQKKNRHPKTDIQRAKHLTLFPQCAPEKELHTIRTVSTAEDVYAFSKLLQCDGGIFSGFFKKYASASYTGVNKLKGLLHNGVDTNPDKRPSMKEFLDALECVIADIGM
jgi:serine/threonine protein kinase